MNLDHFSPPPPPPFKIGFLVPKNMQYSEIYMKTFFFIQQIFHFKFLGLRFLDKKIDEELSFALIWAKLNCGHPQAVDTCGWLPKSSKSVV